jgi:PAS domain S-box-containing protein
VNRPYTAIETTEAAETLKLTMEFTRFTASDLAALRAAAPRISPSLDRLSRVFYDALSSHPATLAAFSGSEQITRLQSTLRHWAAELLTDDRDADYAVKRHRIGAIHRELRIDQKQVLAAMGLVRRFLTDEARMALPPDEVETATRAIERACDVDIIVITDAYHISTRLEDLIEANNRLRRVLDTAPVAVIGYNRAATVVDWNEAAARMFGFQRDEAIGRSWVDLAVLPDDVNFVIEIMRRVFSGEMIPPMDRRLRARDGRIVHAVLAHAPVRGAREIEEGFVFCLDMTELALLREKMVEREKMAALGTLAAGLAHEVRNPLSSISAVCQLVQRKGDDGKLQDRMRQVLEAIDRCEKIVRRVLDFARTRHDESEGPVAIDAVVENVLNLVALDSRLKGMTLARDIEPHLPAVRITRTALAQILINLIFNSGEAGEAGNRIAVRAAARDSGVAITVEDWGPGFSTESLRRGTEPFFTTKDDGTGLGLSISYGILERCGGSIGLRNRPTSEGTGAVVELWLPAHSENPENAAT